jgi:hypothetical protein
MKNQTSGVNIYRTLITLGSLRKRRRLLGSTVITQTIPARPDQRGIHLTAANIQLGITWG